jgi:hypothetical protein
MPEIRLDRFAALHLFPRRAPCLGRIPILMYHAIQDTLAGGGAYYETSTSPSVFAGHMKYLSDNGYSTITLDEAARAVGKSLGDKRPVVLTFDDGYRNFYTAAYPVMRDLGFTGTIFLIAGATGDHRSQFKGIDCLTWSEAREMHANGISIGSHSETHPVLSEIGRPAILAELAGSKRSIEDRIGDPVRSFSYPFAFPEADEALVSYLAETLEECGYENGVSTIIGTAGPANHRYFLPRLPVNTWDDASLFRAKLEGRYDWLRVPQSAFKQMKHRLRAIRSGASRTAVPGAAS